MLGISFGRRLRHAWNTFLNRDPTDEYYIHKDLGMSTSYNPYKTQFIMGNEESIVDSVYNRLAIDVAKLSYFHARIDENDNYIDTINSKLNDRLTVEANIDQAASAFMLDVAMSMFTEGCIAVVPVDTSINPEIGSYDILSMRVGKILEWFPQHVRVRLYNDRSGLFEDKVVSKEHTAIIENPLYETMNKPNSTLQRLIRKLQLLDVVDEQSGSGKLDIIIQLPYVIRSEARKQQAEERRKQIEMQLAGSKYGIAYTDGTEKITQLNRPAENNLMAQVQYLTSMLYNQLGITESVFNGTADEQTMINYWNRTIDPAATAIVEEFKRKFLTKTAISQKQSVMFLREPFSLVSSENLADIADKFTRNEILSPNDIRAVIGYKPSNDPKSDELRNRNINAGNVETVQNGSNKETEKEEEK